jgi:2,4-dienoyl-CoA reductase-like NADH-dependent reductase (Old Yellow Enzyme family)
MTENDIVGIINSFGAAAGRASAAGFDGIHIHSGNGYLLSQFNSPRTNRRADQWGGSAQGRSRFITQVLRAIRDAIGPKLPITARFGVSDAIDGGLTIAESVDRAVLLAGLGLLAIEPTYNIMSSYKQNIRPYAGNSLKHALSDVFLQQLFVRPTPEAYYRSFARTIKQATNLSVFLVGGLRSTSMMDDVIRSGDADFISLARPFIREPDLPKQIERGRRGRVDCVSCNLCFKHEGLDPVQCWRVPKTRLLSHLKKFYFRKC